MDEEVVGEPEQEVIVDTPFVNPVIPVDLGTAIPSVCEKETPKTDLGVSLLQNTPKSNPTPEN